LLLHLRSARLIHLLLCRDVCRLRCILISTGKRRKFPSGRLLLRLLFGLLSAQLIHLLLRGNAPGLCGQHLLPCLEGHRGGSGRLLNDHLPVHDCLRRLDSRWSPCPNDALSHRRHGNTALDLRRLELLRIDTNGGSPHGPRIHKRVVRNSSDRGDVVLVHVSYIVNIYVIIYIGYICHVHGRVRYVDVLHVTRAGAISGHINLARPEREPSHSPASPTQSRSTN
jgi:hypothetical protein